MTQEEMDTIVKRPTPHHRQPGRMHDIITKIRTVLNIVFMIGAVIGVGWYLKVDHNTGIYIIIVSMAFKFVEAAIRTLRL